MKPEKLIYTFVSYASYVETFWGHGIPEEGVDRTAEIAHRHGIPVTWIVNSGSIRDLGPRIRKWHDEYGDDVLLNSPDISSCNYGTRKQNLKQAFESEWDILEEAFPWAKTKVTACGNMDNEMIQVLEELDFQGIWGYCWEQSWWDNITHKGIPWGFWYIDSSRYKVPHPANGKVVACEWTARDLNLSFHTSSPCIYSTDPNDVYRAGLCTGENIDYWKKLFDDYLINTENNDCVFFLQQQEAHEMEVTDAFAVYPFEHVEACTGMLDKFFSYIKSYDITVMSLPEAIHLYHQKNQYTAPSYMLTTDSNIRPEINEYTMTMGGVGMGPWPETFFYYDSQCQMAFIKGKCKPHLLRNYVGKTRMDDDFAEKTPEVFTTKFLKSDTNIEIDFSVDHDIAIPFGITYWDDLTGFKIAKCEGATDARIIQDKLVFIRLNLSGKRQYIRIILEKNKVL